MSKLKEKPMEPGVRKIFNILKLVLLIGIVVGLSLYVILAHPDLISNLKNLDSATEVIESQGAPAALIYLLINVVQIVIAVLPGQVIQFAGGYIFHFPLGMLLTVIGCALGTAASFWLGRLLGRDAIEMFFGKKKVAEYVKFLYTKKGLVVLFILYLIPGFPKDMIAYVAALTKIKFRPLIIISIIGRLPASACSVMMGAMMINKSYVGMIILAVVVCAVSLLAVINRKKLLAYSDVIYSKLYGEDADANADETAGDTGNIKDEQKNA